MIYYAQEKDELKSNHVILIFLISSLFIKIFYFNTTLKMMHKGITRF